MTSLINDIMVESFITIMNTQSLDAGTYTCYAENIIDSDSSSGILTVNGMYVGMFHISSISLTILLQMVLKSSNQLEEKLNTLWKEIMLHLNV